MAKSTLAKLTVPAHSNNYAQGRSGYKICKFTPHHMAGILTAEQCGKIFQNPTRKASSNYGIGNDGTIACYVEEENRAYTSSSKSNDCQAITVEVSNCEVGGEWKISDAAWNSLVALAVDVCQRYNFRLEYDGTKNGSLTRHNMFAPTNCPGPYLQSRFSELAETVNKILDGEQSRPTVVPTPEPTNKKVGDIVTINGIYTASNSTKKLNPARTTGTITKIINGARNPYLLDNGNLGWANDSVIVEKVQTQAPAQPAKLSTKELADAIQAGKYGNGAERFNNLKADGYTDAEINAAQDEVNRRYGVKPVTSNKPVEIRNGDRVQIKSSATHYVTGQAIPSRVKNKTYTVMQKGEGKSLLREIMSWVYDRDLTK